MDKIRSAILKLILLFSFSISLAGCIPPLAINTIGAASSSSPVAFNHLGGGKGESFWIAHYDDVVAAAMRAAEALSLEVREKKIDKDRAFFRFADTLGKTIDLTVERRTETMTSILFDVGWSGSVAFGRLLANQIVFELIDTDSFLEDWTPEIHN